MRWNCFLSSLLKTIGVLCLLPLLLFAKESAQNIWIKNPQMPRNEFKIHIKALGSPHKSYAQHLLQQKREKSKAFQLKQKLVVAQELYLSGEEQKTVKAFQNITKLALKMDWDKEDRRIILYSFLRIAQHVQDPEKRKALLLSAISFAPFQINKKHYSDYNLFPPPLMAELEIIQEKTNSLLLDWEAIFPQHEIILINGNQIQKNKKEKISQSFYRVTALSSSHQIWSQNLNLSELLTQKIKTKSLTKGVCKNLQFHVPQNHIQILPFSNCPKKTNLLFAKESNKKTSKSLSTTVTHLNFENFQIEMEELSSNKKNDFKLAPWLIIGTGIIIFSLVLSLNKSKKPPEQKKPQEDFIPPGEFIY